MNKIIALVGSLVVMSSAYASTPQEEIAAIQKLGGNANTFYLEGVTSTGERCLADINLTTTPQATPVMIEVSNEKDDGQGHLILDGSVDAQFDGTQADNLQLSDSELTITNTIHVPSGSMDGTWVPVPSHDETSTVTMKSVAGQITEVNVTKKSSNFLVGDKGNMTCSSLKPQVLK